MARCLGPIRVAQYALSSKLAGRFELPTRAPRQSSQRSPQSFAISNGKAVLAPRTSPRLEQYIRTGAAERLGLLRMLHRPRDGEGPEVMAAAIRGLLEQPPPSTHQIPGLMDGLTTIVERAALCWTKAAE